MGPEGDGIFIDGSRPLLRPFEERRDGEEDLRPSLRAAEDDNLIAMTVSYPTEKRLARGFI